MTVFTIIETYGDDTSEVVAVCDSHASAIQWLIENKKLSEKYSLFSPIYSQYISLEKLFGKNWLKTLLEEKWFFFHLDGLDYEIEERELFSKSPCPLA